MAPIIKHYSVMRAIKRTIVHNRTHGAVAKAILGDWRNPYLLQCTMRWIDTNVSRLEAASHSNERQLSYEL